MSSGTLRMLGSRLKEHLSKGLRNFMRAEPPADAPPEHPEMPVHWVSSSLAVGPAPSSTRQLNALKELGVCCILNLVAEMPELANIEQEHGFEVHYLPVEDEEAPDLKALEAGLAWVDEALYLGRRVYIHCRHGIGRTGTVLNAYLLRRGMGHRLAARTLARLRSQPGNFEQWRTVRQYGAEHPRLRIRKPSLEFGKSVDLGPFIDDYNRLTERIDRTIHALPAHSRCGMDNDRCCRSPVSMHLVEAMALTTSINTNLSSEDRKNAMERAVEVARKERMARRSLAGEFCLSDADTLCPLSRNGKCLVFSDRPMKCRLFGIPPQQADALWRTTITPPLAELSGQVFVSLAESLPPDRLPMFPLPEVISGMYVQTMFTLMRTATVDRGKSADTSANTSANTSGSTSGSTSESPHAKTLDSTAERKTGGTTPQ